MSCRRRREKNDIDTRIPEKTLPRRGEGEVWITCFEVLLDLCPGVTDSCELQTINVLEDSNEIGAPVAGADNCCPQRSVHGLTPDLCRLFREPCVRRLLGLHKLLDASIGESEIHYPASIYD